MRNKNELKIHAYINECNECFDEPVHWIRWIRIQKNDDRHCHDRRCHYLNVQGIQGIQGTNPDQKSRSATRI